VGKNSRKNKKMQKVDKKVRKYLQMSKIFRNFVGFYVAMD